MDLKKLLDKTKWNIVTGVSAMLVFFLTLAIVLVRVIMGAIAAQTHEAFTLFTNWWQTLMFVADVIIFVILVFSIVMLVLRHKPVKRRFKAFNKSVWTMLSVFFAVLTVIMFVGGAVGNTYETVINSKLGLETTKRVDVDDGGEKYHAYKSDYEILNEKGEVIGFDDEKMRANSLAVAREVAGEGSVLLWNKEVSDSGVSAPALPLKNGSKISFFGIDSAAYVHIGEGSGYVPIEKPSIVEECKKRGLIVNERLASAYSMLADSRKYGKTRKSNVGVDDINYGEYEVNEVPWSKIDSTILGSVTGSAATYGDAAVMVIGRTAGECIDTDYSTTECLENSYMDLSKEEKSVIERLQTLKNAGSIKRIILLINSANAMQFKNISTLKGIDACVWVGMGGSAYAGQIADVLSGAVNPSGRLTDTYVYDNNSAPSTENFGDYTFTSSSGLPKKETYTHNNKYVVYGEGIYVGYRYYETRYEDSVLGQGNANGKKGIKAGSGNWKYTDEVAYPFGFGLSYTTFEYSDYKIEKGIGGYVASVTVKNTGKVAGKEVVQMYLQKPYTDYDKEKRIEKASVELVGYKKTALLAPNATETVKIFVSDEEFASYDADGYKTYIVEKGSYYLATGKNSHDALNNILAKKGKTTVDGMDYNGNAALSAIVEKDLDTETFVKSTATGNKITNQFEDADVKKYEGLKGQFDNYEYLSRSNWESTYPEAVNMACTSEKMIADMQYVKPVTEDKNAVMPTIGVANTNDKKLVELYGKDYNDPAWTELLTYLSWEDLNVLCSAGSGSIAGLERVNMPTTWSKDGPAGISTPNKRLSETCFCFPSEGTIAATFNDELVTKLGSAFGMEVIHVGSTGIYAPGSNIHRSAYGGRNMEYYSEDPFLNGKMTSAQVKGMQSRGVIVFTKHFVLNDQERNRYGGTVWANEQTIREIYLKAFKAGVTEGKMNGVMSSFNRIGCTWTGKHKGLLTEVLRNEWGFVGMVESDAFVGKHMDAFGEGIVAGNDLWMGSSRPNGWDKWKQSPTVVSALVESAHRILYTKLNSYCMTGMSTGTIIIEVTPWWKTAILIAQIGIGVITAGCFVMLALSFVFAGKEDTDCIIYKEKDNVMCMNSVKNQEKKQKNEKRKQVEMKIFNKECSKKKFSIILTTVIAVLLVAILTPIIITNVNGNKTPGSSGGGTAGAHVCQSVCEVCGGCKNADCKEAACKEKCTCKQGCEHACPVCGKCVDPTSTEEKCKEKCGDNRKNAIDFAATDGMAYNKGGEKGELTVNGNILSNFKGNKGAMLVFFVSSDKDTVASMYLYMTRSGEDLDINKEFDILVNGEKIKTSPTLNKKAGEAEEVGEIGVGCVNLVKGRNIISIVALKDTSGADFEKITLKADSTLGWYIKSAEEKCEHACPVCGNCVDPDAVDINCFPKCGHDKKTLYTFEAEDERVVLKAGDRGLPEVSKEDGAELTYIGNFAHNVGASIVYSIKADKATTATLYVSIIKREGDKFTDIVKVRVNGEEMPSAAVVPVMDNPWPDWTSFITVRIRCLNLVKGNNEISFTNVSGKSGYNFDKMMLACNDILDWGNEAHKCTQVCELCGGCTDSACQKPACANKCTCQELKIEAEDYTAINNPLPADGSQGSFGKKEKASASGGAFIGGVLDVSMNAAGKGYLEYEIYSDKNTTIRFGISAAVGATSNKSSLGITVTYADESSADFTATEGTMKGSGWEKFVEINYGKIDLKEGKNTIRISVKAYAAIDIDYFVLNATKDVTLVVYKYLTIEAENYTAINNPLPADGSQGSFGKKEKSSASGGAFIGGVLDVSMNAAGKGYLEYEIYSDKNTTIDFLIYAAIGATSNKSSLGITVTYADGSSTDFTATEGTMKGSGWEKFVEINYGKIDLKEGKNTIRISMKAYAAMDIDYFMLKIANGANLRTTA